MTTQAMHSDQKLEELVEVLRSNGARVTSPRRAILRALVEHDGHPTAEMLTADVQRGLPDVHVSTVYRFLDDLEGLGIIDHVHLGHGPSVYHFIDDAHNHLVCESCGSVQEVPVKTIEHFRQQLLDDFDFVLAERHFAIPGQCKGCASRK